MPIAVAQAAEAGGTVSPISFEPWTFLFQAINVLIVLFVLYRFLFKPVGELLHKRESTIESALAEARSAREEAERLRAEYRTKVAEAQREAQEIVERATRAAEARGNQLVQEAQAEALRTLERARAEIAAERERALSEIRGQVADLVVLAAGQVIGRSLTGEDHRRLAQEFIDKAGELQ